MIKNISQIVAALCLLWCADAMARTGCYDRAIEMEAGWHSVDTLKSGAIRADAHLRVKMPRHNDAKWGLAWNWRDSLHYTLAEVRPLAMQEDIYGNRANITVFEVEEGEKSRTLAEKDIVYGNSLSLKIVYDGYSARLYTGDLMQELVDYVPFDDASNQIFRLWCQQNVECLRLTVDGMSGQNHEHVNFETVDDLLGYLRASIDPLEGMWKYLDRDITTTYAALGGKYTLATVAQGDGKYAIVYIGGAEADQEKWDALMIKGTMEPTIFTNSYNLRWIDSKGVIIDDDCYVEVSGTSMLMLKFPTYQSQIRLSRVDLNR